ncbi:MAG: beta-sandwich domain-containing protein [Pseudobdellovibrionaceae bacterium]
MFFLKKIVIASVLFGVPLLAEATFTQTISKVTRASGGQLYQFNFSGEAGNSRITFAASNFKVLVHNAFVVLDDGNAISITEDLPSDVQGQRFISKGQQVSVRMNEQQNIIGLGIQAESFGGFGDLRIGISSTGAVIQKIPVFPLPNKNFPGSKGDELVCVGSKQGSGWFELFRLSDGQSVGGLMNQATCQRALTTIRNGLICAASSHGSGWYEMFRTQSGQSLGGLMNESTCVRVLQQSTFQLVCVASVHGSGWFELIRSFDGKSIGGLMNESSCLSSMKNISGDLVCAASQQGSGWYEMFSSSQGKSIGGLMNQPTCLEVVQSQRSGFVCSASNQGSGWFELFRIDNGSVIGGLMNKAQCLQAVGIQ